LVGKRFLLNNHRMRKIYEQPYSGYIVLKPCVLLATSGSQEETGSAIGSGTVNPEESWVEESRCDWSDIWESI
jgi:hypothetical protein